MSWSRSEPAEWMTFAYSTCLAVRLPPRVLREQPGEDQQAVQRGAQLVGHVREELRLVLRGERELPGPFLDLLPGQLDLRVLGLDVLLLRGEQLRLVLQVGVGLLQFLRPRLQLGRARLQLGRQPLRLLEQRVGAGVGDDRVDADPERLGELLKEGDLDRRELAERGELDHAEHLVLEQDRA